MLGNAGTDPGTMRALLLNLHVALALLSGATAVSRNLIKVSASHAPSDECASNLDPCPESYTCGFLGVWVVIAWLRSK